MSLHVCETAAIAALGVEGGRDPALARALSEALGGSSELFTSGHVKKSSGAVKVITKSIAKLNSDSRSVIGGVPMSDTRCELSLLWGARGSFVAASANMGLILWCFDTPGEPRGQLALSDLGGIHPIAVPWDRTAMYACDRYEDRVVRLDMVEGWRTCIDFVTVAGFHDRATDNGGTLKTTAFSALRCIAAHPEKKHLVVSDRMMLVVLELETDCARILFGEERASSQTDSHLLGGMPRLLRFTHDGSILCSYDVEQAHRCLSFINYESEMLVCRLLLHDLAVADEEPLHMLDVDDILPLPTHRELFLLSTENHGVFLLRVKFGVAPLFAVGRSGGISLRRVVFCPHRSLPDLQNSETTRLCGIREVCSPLPTADDGELLALCSQTHDVRGREDLLHVVAIQFERVSDVCQVCEGVSQRRLSASAQRGSNVPLPKSASRGDTGTSTRTNCDEGGPRQTAGRGANSRSRFMRHDK